jgi:hypothetical protein
MRWIEWCKQSWSGFDQNNAGTAWIDGAKIRRQRALRQFSDGAGHLHAGRAAADHHEVQKSTPFICIRLGFGTLEGEQDAAAQVGGIIDRLQAWRVG